MFSGTVVELHGKDGDTLKVGTPLITVSGGGSVDAVVSANHERYREEERAGSGNVLIGYGTSEDAPRRRRKAAPSVRVISPIVRKLAVDNDIDLSLLSGDGRRDQAECRLARHVRHCAHLALRRRRV